MFTACKTRGDLGFTARPLSIVALAALLLLALWGSTPARVLADDQKAPPKDSRYVCPGCLTPVSGDADKCPECGLVFRKLEYICPVCSTTISWDTTVCPTCGQKFTPPAPGEKERRSAIARSVPEPRDFLTEPPAGEENDSMTVHGYSLSLWRTGKETTFGGRHPEINRFLEDASVTVQHLGIPQLSFYGAGMLISDPQFRPENTITFTLREAYLRYENDDATTQANAGRQFINCGVTRDFVDGLFVHQMIGDRLGVEGFAGLPVAAEKSDIEGDFEVGGRVFWRGITSDKIFRDFTFGLSARDELWDSRVIRQDLGVDFSWSPTWEVDISGHVYYNVVDRDFYDARATLQLRPTAWMNVTIDYRYIVPADLLPSNSVLAVFADDRRHSLELDVDVFPSDRVKIGGYVRGYYIPNESFNTQISGVQIDLGREVPYELGGTASLKHGETLKGEVGVQASLLAKAGMQKYQGATVYSASVFQFRIYEMLAYELTVDHTLKGSLDIHWEANDGKLYVRQNSATTVTATAGYSYQKKYTVTLGADYRSTPDFSNTGDVFAKLEVLF